MSPALLTVEEITHLAESVVDDETRNMGAVYVMLSLMQQWDTKRGRRYAA